MSEEAPADQLSAQAQEWRSAIRFARGALSLIDRKAICSLIAQINGERVVLADRLSAANALITTIHDALNREAVARLIEPRAWMTVREIAVAKGLDAANLPPGVIIMQEIDQPVVAMQGLRDQSLMKADQIIAMFREAGR